MMKMYDSKIIKDCINKIKKDNVKILTNIIMGRLLPDKEYEAVMREKALCFLDYDSLHRRQSLFFIGSDEDSIANVINQIKGKNIFCDYFSKIGEDEYKELMIKSGLTYHSTYVRYTNIYKDNPYLYPEVGRRKILLEMYDPTTIEYATENDIPELIRINEDLFIPCVDDFFSYEEWKEIEKKKECLICREEGRIIAFYVFRIEGKKFYSNMIANYGPANISYNMERYAIEKAWNNGIRVFYCWIRQDNSKALKRGKVVEPEYILRTDYLWNYIYKL